MAQTAVEKKQEQTVEQAVEELTRRDVVRLEASGKEVTVRICKVRDIPAFLSLIGKLFTDLSIQLGDVSAMEREIAVKMNDAPLILKLISTRWDEVVSVLAKLTTLRKEEVEDLDIDDAILLVKKAVEINYAFFMRRILPMVPGELAGKLADAGSADET